LKVIGTFLMMWALGPGVGTEPGLLRHAGASKGLAYSLAAGISITIAYGPEAGLKAGVFAAAFAFVGGSEAFGELKKVTAERVIAHAVLGCVQQASSGGQCGPGAAAAAFGKIATGLTQGLGGAAQFAVTTVVGGTVSVIGGGKFANGAAQAGFGYLFNHATQSFAERMASDIQSGKFAPDPKLDGMFVEGGKLLLMWTPQGRGAVMAFDVAKVSLDAFKGDYAEVAGLTAGAASEAVARRVLGTPPSMAPGVVGRIAGYVGYAFERAVSGAAKIVMSKPTHAPSYWAIDNR
ncbi:MAG: hypothetical protein ACK58C_04065, partial [Betaproteobacteria bacterium]